VAGSGGNVSVGVVWFLGNVWPKASLSAEAGAAISGGVATALLFVGRHGLAGIKDALLHGWRK
jgi:hypothetical protein